MPTIRNGSESFRQAQPGLGLTLWLSLQMVITSNGLLHPGSSVHAGPLAEWCMRCVRFSSSHSYSPTCCHGAGALLRES